MPEESPERVFPIVVVSGGFGASGEQIARTVLAQFTGAAVPVQVVAQVRKVEQIAEAVARARAQRGIILHTLVDPELRAALIHRARESNVVAIDLIGRVLSHLTMELGRRPAGKPGLYRQLREDYFRRVEAIEFTLAHDDGMRIEDLDQSEIILVGPSRVGKTPLSIYLSTLGWKVANVPIVKDIPLRSELLRADHRRIVALNIDPVQLMAHRRRRQRGLRAGKRSPYTDPESILEEIEEARRIYRKEGFPVVDMSNRQIEEAADEVVNLTRAAHEG